MSVTFDDADASLVDVAMPVMAEHGISACCYTVPDYVEKGVSWRSSVPRPIMNWKNLAVWLSAGHEVGSHTLTHASINACSVERVRQEAEWSQDVLQQKLGISVDHFAYPWGQHTSKNRETLRGLNVFKSVATIHRGPMSKGHDPFSLRRDAASFAIRQNGWSSLCGRLTDSIGFATSGGTGLRTSKRTRRLTGMRSRRARPRG